MEGQPGKLQFRLGTHRADHKTRIVARELAILTIHEIPTDPYVVDVCEKNVAFTSNLILVYHSLIIFSVKDDMIQQEVVIFIFRLAGHEI